MAKFIVTYVVTTEQTYTLEVSAKDADTAEDKAKEKLSNVSGSKYPGDMEEEETDFDIQDVSEA